MKLIGPIELHQKWGFLSESGEWAIEPVYQLLGDFREGLAGFGELGKMGFINEQGVVVIEPRFEPQSPHVIWGFRDGLAPVLATCTSYIDRNGKVVLALPSSGRGRHFIGGRSVFMNSEGTCSVVDLAGERISTLPIYEAPFVRDWPEDWESFGCWFMTGGLTAGAINWKGEIVFEPKHADLGSFVCGVAPFSISEDVGGYGLIRITGEVILEPSFFSISPFTEGLAAAAKFKRKYGFINLQGEWVIEPKYRDVDSFSNGIACVTMNDDTRRGKKGFINTKGEMVIDARFDRAWRVGQGHAEVEYEGKRAMINNLGRAIWETPISVRLANQ